MASTTHRVTRKKPGASGPRIQPLMSRGGVVERLGLVDDRTVDEARLAAVADARAAGPVRGRITRLGELEQAAVALVPRDGESRAAERDLGTPAGWPGRRMRCRRVVARLGAEHLTVQPCGVHSPCERPRREVP